jgi:hypothetical protein
MPRERLIALLGLDRPIDDAYPLSPMQEGMLFHSVDAPDSGVYVAQLRYALSGDLDVAALRAAWQQAVDRHPSLRTGFHWGVGAVPLQVVSRDATIDWTELDWRQLSETVRQQQLKEFLVADRRRGFDLTSAPLMRFALVRTADAAWELIWSHHHLILDGWSLPLVSKEVVDGYEARRHGETPRFDAPVPYADYIAWLARQESGAAERYWRGALAGVRATTPLPRAPLHRSADDAITAATVRVQLSARRTAALKRWTRTRRLTLNSLFAGLWATLLGRESGTDDVVFGGVVSGRPPELAGSDRCVGLFINTLPVRVTPSGGTTDLAQWLHYLQTQQAGQRQYEFVPLVRVRGWSELPQDAPFFETLLVFENYPAEAPASALAQIQVRNTTYAMTESYPLVLAVGPGRQLAFELKFDSRRVDAARVQQLGTIVEEALTALAGGRVATIADLRQTMDRADEALRAADAVRSDAAATELLQEAKQVAAARRRRGKGHIHAPGPSTSRP